MNATNRRLVTASHQLPSTLVAWGCTGSGGSTNNCMTDNTTKVTRATKATSGSRP